MLKITIEGPPGSGKTTLAIFIRAALQMAGLYNVTYEGVDEYSVRSPPAHSRAMRALSEKNVEIVITQRTTEG